MSEPSVAEPFASLIALRTAHTELLKRHRIEGETPEVLRAAEQFLMRGRATGALLAEEDDRWVAQSTLDYWSTTLYRAGEQSSGITLVEFNAALAPELPDNACPYVGLNAFGEEKAELFFGRRAVIAELITRLHNERLLAVVGPSGSGKSSLIRAGLLPALRTAVVPDLEQCCILLPFVPGSAPLYALERALHVVSSTAQAPLLLVIDQFEETFTLCTDEPQRAAFLARLIELVSAPSLAHRVILTMRSDFEPFVARAEGLLPLFEAGKVSVSPLSAGELREVIERPAERVGLKFESGLVDSLLQDILGEPAALPLLQFTLLKLWEQREHNRVLLSTYRRVGGGRLALARSADALYAGLIPEEQVTARRILLRMVRPGDGLEVTSNRIRRADLDRGGEDPGRVARVLDKLVAAHLLRLTPGETLDDTQVEVAHEALVRNWPTLVEWLEDERLSLRQRQRLNTAAHEWQRLGRPESALLRGALLAETLGYDDLSPLEAAFVTSSSEAEVAAQVREQRAAQRLRQLTWLASVAAVIATVAALIAGMGFYQANLQRMTAEANQQVADQQRVTAEANQQVADQQRATAEANQQVADQQRATAEANQQVADQQRATAEASQLLANEQRDVIDNQRLAFAAQGQLQQRSEVGLLLAYEVVSRNDTLFARNVLSLALEANPWNSTLIRGHSDQVNSAMFSPDGTQILTASDDKT